MYKNFWPLITLSVLISVAIATIVAVEFHWGWGLASYFACNFILDALVIAYCNYKLNQS